MYEVIVCKECDGLLVPCWKDGRGAFYKCSNCGRLFDPRVAYNPEKVHIEEEVPKLLLIGERQAEEILQMAADCYSEGFLTDEGLAIVAEIRNRFPKLKDKNKYLPV